MSESARWEGPVVCYMGFWVRDDEVDFILVASKRGVEKRVGRREAEKMKRWGVCVCVCFPWYREVK